MMRDPTFNCSLGVLSRLESLSLRFLLPPDLSSCSAGIHSQVSKPFQSNAAVVVVGSLISIGIADMM